VSKSFGGDWTEKKLRAVEDYFRAYLTIMRGNERAQWFTTTYVDAFAGPGLRYAASQQEQPLLFDDFRDSDTEGFLKGSPYRAMDLPQPFDRYVFVDLDQTAVEALKALIARDFSHLNAETHCADANAFLQEWVRRLGPKDRAVVFLDPYGLQVQWNTIEALGRSQQVDLWVLVPWGQALVRLITRGEPPEAWARRLDIFFGTGEWREQVLRSKMVETLFGREGVLIRDVSALGGFLLERLRNVFAGVLDTPVRLNNTKGNTLYLLCFAASNPKGARTAVKIARDIATRLNDG
jgi:three-Cys-motif partner protein